MAAKAEKGPETRTQVVGEGVIIGLVGLSMVASMPIRLDSIPATAVGVALVILGVRVATRPITSNSPNS